MSKFLEMYGSDEVVQESYFGNYAYSNYEVVEEGFFDNFLNWVKQLWEKVKRFFIKIWNWIKGVFSKNDKSVHEQIANVRELIQKEKYTTEQTDVESKNHTGSKALTAAKNIKFPEIENVKDVIMKIEKLKNLLIADKNVKPSKNTTEIEWLKIIDDKMKSLEPFENFKISVVYKDQRDSNETNPEKILSIAETKWKQHEKNVEYLIGVCKKYIGPMSNDVIEAAKCFNENTIIIPELKKYYPKLKSVTQRTAFIFINIMRQVADLAPEKCYVKTTKE